MEFTSVHSSVQPEYTSVAPWTVCILRFRGTVIIDRISAFADSMRSWHTDGDEESVNVSRLEVLSDSGWVMATRLMRRKSRTTVHRLRTAAGSVDVLEGHGMLRADGTRIQVETISVGDTLAESSLDSVRSNNLERPPSIRVPVTQLLRRDASPRDIAIIVPRTTDLARLMSAALSNLADNRFMFPLTPNTRTQISRAASIIHPEFSWVEDAERRSIIGHTKSIHFLRAAEKMRKMYQAEARKYPLFLLNAGNASETSAFTATLSLPYKDTCRATIVALRVLFARQNMRTSVGWDCNSKRYILREVPGSAEGAVVTSVETLPAKERTVYSLAVPGVLKYDVGGVVSRGR